MFKRTFWLLVGFTLGVVATLRAQSTLRRQVERALPPTAAIQLRRFNLALEERAAEIRARREGRLRRPFAQEPELATATRRDNRAS